MAKESFRTVALRRLLGVAFIGVLIGLVSLSIAVYNKAFTPTVNVTLRTDHTGNQLLLKSDVKERGIIVGSVKKVHSVGDGAVITLALDPGRVPNIPNNVLAQILPKTIFGEQYISLVIPDNNPPGTPAIKKGDVIQQDRSGKALETEKVLGDILPVLNALDPVALKNTLTAMATALRGRGAALGQTLVTLDNYLKQFNPAVPQLVDDLNKLGQVALKYNDAAPDIIATLDNFTASAQTLIDRQAAFDTVLSTATNTSNIFSSFLGENKQRLITVTDTSDKIYAVLATYAPSFTCTFHALVKLNQLESDSIVHNQIQLSAQLVVPDPRLAKYKVGQKPQYITGFPPDCQGLPNPVVPFKIPGKYRCVNDGAPLTLDACSLHGGASAFDQQAMGSPLENTIVDTIIARSLNTTPNNVPGIATALAAPALRGAEVSVS